MKKNYLIFATLITITILLATSIILIAKEKTQPNYPSCLDCGKAGWEKMNLTCNQKNLTKPDFKNCLKSFSWSQVSDQTDVSEIKEGYIQINGFDISKTPKVNLIKVLIFKQWAVDENGNLYLLGHLG